MCPESVPACVIARAPRARTQGAGEIERCLREHARTREKDKSNQVALSSPSSRGVRRLLVKGAAPTVAGSPPRHEGHVA